MPLYKDNETTKKHDLISLRVIEIKTKSSLLVIHELEAVIEIRGTNFRLCEDGLRMTSRD